MNAGKVAEHGGASASGHGLFCHRVSDPIEQMDKAFLIVFGQILEQLGDSVDANPLVFMDRFFPRLGQYDVDLAFVLRIDPAFDERPLPRFQRTNHARHLRGQDSQQPLHVSHDHGGAILEKRQSEIFDLLQVSRAPPARRRQAQMRNDLVQIMGNRLEPFGGSLRRRPGTGSDHVGSSLPLNP